MGLRRTKGRYGGLRIALIALWAFFSTTALHKGIMSMSFEYSYDNMDLQPGVDVDPNVRARTPLPRSTLVHYDPYFMGGFRNQHMRFVAFVARAVESNVSQILLPSLRWMDHSSKRSMHHELLFDVDYWNSRAAGAGLPLLVDYDPDVLEGIIRTYDVNVNESTAAAVVPCWNETSGLYSGLDEAVLRHPQAKLRKIRTWDMIGQGSLYSHCRRSLVADADTDKDGNHPVNIEEASRRIRNDKSTISTHKVDRFTHLIPHGGFSGGSGRLWFEYEHLQKQNNREKASVATIINSKLVRIHPEHVPVERAIYKLLRPRECLLLAAKNAVRDAWRRNNNGTRDGDARGTDSGALPRLLALHPRVEQEMLTHQICSKFMEKNLTRALEQLQNFPPLLESDGTGGYRFDLAFIAVSRKMVEQKPTRGGELGEIMAANKIALNDARDHGLFSSGSGSDNGNGNDTRTTIPIFESGTGSAAKVQFPRIRPTSALQFVTGSKGRIYAHWVPKRNTSEETPFVTATDLGMLEMVASVINFFTAVEADIFVGVKGSTFSTDVISMRYYRRKEEGGRENYILGPEGIERFYGPAAPLPCA